MELQVPSKARVVLIGWDAADWRIIRPLVKNGHMPTIASFVREGTVGDLRSLHPMISPILWTSIASGKLPYKHGVLGFVEPDPDFGGVRSVGSTSRKVKALWSIASEAGLTAHVVGWFATHPAESLKGVCVSDAFWLEPPLDSAAAWRPPVCSVHPLKVFETFCSLRVHPSTISYEDLVRFVPSLDKCAGYRDGRVEKLRSIIAQTRSLSNVVKWLCENSNWSFLAVHFHCLDDLCHEFMSFRGPRLPGLSNDLFLRYSNVIDEGYRFLDCVCNEFLNLIGSDVVVFLASDHGFHSNHLRSLPSQTASEPAHNHRPWGVICIKGPGIVQGKEMYGATILDIAPTILTTLGLPVGDDMDGRVLKDVFQSPPNELSIPSWENKDSETRKYILDFMLAEEMEPLLRQYEALGYIEQRSNEKVRDAVRAATLLKYNLARSLMDSRKCKEAIPLLQELLGSDLPDERCRVLLAQCQLSLGRAKLAKRILTSSASSCEAFQGTAAQIYATLLWAEIYYGEGNEEKVTDCLVRVEQGEHNTPYLLVRCGQLYLKLRRAVDAQRVFQRCCEMDENIVPAFVGLAAAHLELREYREAEQAACSALRLRQRSPRAHFYLGLALKAQHLYDSACSSFKTALIMDPQLRQAHHQLAAIYDHRREFEIANSHRQQAENLARGPRSRGRK